MWGGQEKERACEEGGETEVSRSAITNALGAVLQMMKAMDEFPIVHVRNLDRSDGVEERSIEHL